MLPCPLCVRYEIGICLAKGIDLCFCIKAINWVGGAATQEVNFCLMDVIQYLNWARRKISVDGSVDIIYMSGAPWLVGLLAL